MNSLKHRLADHGFISNEDYDFPVQCLLSARCEHIRCLNVEGELGRRKTAFADALAHALDYEHVLYHEFTGIETPPPLVRIAKTDNEQESGDIPIDDLDRIIGEACALSEAEPTALILDQLHNTRFKNHLKLAEFIKTLKWTYQDVTLQANPNRLFIIMISDERLFHTLRQLCFSIWVASVHEGETGVTFQDLGLTEDAQPMIDALNNIFTAIGVKPTFQEYEKVINDIHVNVNKLEELKQSLFGWVEGIDRNALNSSKIEQILTEQMEIISQYLGIEDDSDKQLTLVE